MLLSPLVTTPRPQPVITNGIMLIILILFWLNLILPDKADPQLPLKVPPGYFVECPSISHKCLWINPAGCFVSWCPTSIFLSSLVLAHTHWALLGPLYHTLRTLLGLSPSTGPPKTTDIFTGHDCDSKTLTESNPGVPWHVGKCPLPHYMSRLTTWPQNRVAYAPVSLETLGEKSWTFSFRQKVSDFSLSGSVKGSWGRVGTDIILTFLSLFSQRPLSFCLGSIK